MNYLLPLDVLTLLVLWWTAQAALAGGHAVESWSDILRTMSLIGIQISGFIGAAVVFVNDEAVIPWWIRILLYSFGGLALWFYEYRFGIGRHLRMYARSAREIPADVRRWIHDTRERLHGRTPAKRKPHA